MNERNALDRVLCCADALGTLIAELCNNQYYWTNETDPQAKADNAKVLLRCLADHADTCLELTKIIRETASTRKTAINDALEAQNDEA